MIKKLLNSKILLFLFFTAVTVLFIGAAISDGGKGRLHKTTADFYIMDINNLFMPMDNTGVLGDVSDIGGKFDGHVFLFSGGFFVSGVNPDGLMWGNGVMSASRITDYRPGPVGSNPLDPKHGMYVVNSSDAPFGESWQEWKTAVDLGADFWDGDGDGIYNPVDLNGNGIWDPDEDRPDLIGDEVVWTVYNDGVAKGARRFNVDPQGIEVHQSVYGFQSAGILGNMLFIRYRMHNKSEIDWKDVYFTVAADPDLGEYTDDLVGCDTILSAGYTYNNGPDAVYGANPPCFLIDFFQGPVAYLPGETFIDVNGNGVYDPDIDTPLDTAYDVKGQVMGVEIFPGAKNLPLTSFTQYMQSHPTHGDPNTETELRFYQLGGKGKQGDPIDPCGWTFGSVVGGVDCNAVDPKFMYSGNPVANRGWINIEPIDQRQMSNSGPFVLNSGESVDIVVAYIVGRGADAKQSITVAKDISVIAQTIFDNNFPAPPPIPAVRAEVSTGEDFIDIIWPTADQFNYSAVDTDIKYDLRFHSYNVYAFRTNSLARVIGNVENEKLYTHYTVSGFIDDVYEKNKLTGGTSVVFKKADAENILDPAIYKDPNTGRVRLRIKTDPFTGAALVKGQEYYFAITSTALNYDGIVHRGGAAFGTVGDYQISDDASIGYSENSKRIIRVVFGYDLYNPGFDFQPTAKAQGPSSGMIKYEVLDKKTLTGDEYSISFMMDSTTATYSTYWRLRNETKNIVLIDSSKKYHDFEIDDASGKLTDGFIARVGALTPVIGTALFTDTESKWYADLGGGLGAFYAGSDIAAENVRAFFYGANRSTFIKADRIRKVELVFGETSKAYRYLRGFTGAGVGRRNSYTYAGGVTASDTNSNAFGGGLVGKFGEGFVDVPFAAYVVDSVYGQDGANRRRLAVAFTEKSPVSGGKPDGVWDPGVLYEGTEESIVIFDTDYSETPQKLYTGGDFDGTTVWADVVRGYTIPAGASGVSANDRRIASSKLLNSLYVVSLQRDAGNPAAVFTGKLTIPVATYPYTNDDVYTFKTTFQGALTADQEKELWEKVNVFPNPLFAYNPATNYFGNNADEPFISFSNLPAEVTVKIYSLSGTLIRTLNQTDKRDGISSPFLQWNLTNEASLRVASGVYLAIVTSPKFGDKVLKFSVILPQKQIQRF
jgi:hypothetical protein